MTTYLNTLNADGSFNLSAIMRIALANARHERNALICQQAGVLPPPRMYGECAEFFALEAAKVKIRRYVGEWSAFLARELRRVWEIARVMRAARQKLILVYEREAA
jgi:hypothetical protein